jgi:hypothetical protein
MAYCFSHLAPLDNIKNINDNKELTSKYPKYNFRKIVSNYLQKPATLVNFKRKNTKIIIEGNLILDYNRIIHKYYIEYILINYKKLIRKVALCMHKTSHDDLKWIYFIAKNNKVFIYYNYSHSITIKFYSSESFNRLIIEDYEEDPLYIKYKRQGRLSSVKYESDNFYKLFLYYYKEYKIYIRIDIEDIILKKHFDNTFIRNIYKHYYIFI